MKWACADCGHEQADDNRCEECDSFRVVLISVLEDQFGKDWRENF